MSKEMYSKYKNFLIEYGLFDEEIFEFINSKSVLINYKKIDEFKSFKCAIVVNENGTLIDVIPCVPFLKNDECVAINIFVYVQAMMLIANIGKFHDERNYSDLFPLIFQKLYILENKNYNILEYEKKMLKKLFESKGMNYNNVIENKEILINEYNKNNKIFNNSLNKTKRRAKNYVNKYNEKRKKYINV